MEQAKVYLLRYIHLYVSHKSCKIPGSENAPKNTQPFHKSQKENDKKDSKVILALIPFHPRFINQTPLFYPGNLAYKQDPCLKGREEKNCPFLRKPICHPAAPMHRDLLGQKREDSPCSQESDPAQNPGSFVVKKQHTNFLLYFT